MTPRSSLSEDEITELADLPPSAKLVFKMLQYKGELTQKELCEETQLAPRTVRYATRRLEKNGIITSEISIRDARQNIYSLTSNEDEEADLPSQ